MRGGHRPAMAYVGPQIGTAISTVRLSVRWSLRLIVEQGRATGVELIDGNPAYRNQ